MTLKELLGDAYREGMNAEEISAAIKEKKLVDPASLPPQVSKETFDKTAKELAELKHQAKERMTAEEAEKAQHQETLERLASLEKENARMKHERSLLGAGYDQKTAAELAECLSEGNLEDFVKKQSAWLAARDEQAKAQIKAELLKETPPLGGGAQKPPEGEQSVALSRELAKAALSGRASAEDVFKHYGA